MVWFYTLNTDMPELPEVETVMRGLQLRLEGRRVLRAVARRADLRWPLPPGLAAPLTGATVTSFRRRAKYILMRLDSGWSVLLHLGMSGRMLLEPVGRPGGRSDITLHEHLEIETDDGWRGGFVDPRRFGSIDLIETDREDSHRLLAELGPEPLDDAFSIAVLETALKGRKTPIKAALLDQKIVAGLGNIYVCESLFRAGISPLRLAASVRGVRARRLVPAIKAPRAGRRCGTMCKPMVNWATFSTPGKCTDAKASRVPPVPRAPRVKACGALSNPAAAHSIVLGFSDRRGTVRAWRCLRQDWTGADGNGFRDIRAGGRRIIRQSVLGITS